jgi:hypothetical protein
MFPFMERFAVVLLAGEALSRVARHPRVAPFAQSRTGKLALMALTFGMGRHRKTHAAGTVVRRALRHSRAV